MGYPSATDRPRKTGSGVGSGRKRWKRARICGRCKDLSDPRPTQHLGRHPGATNYFARSRTTYIPFIFVTDLSYPRVNSTCIAHSSAPLVA
jgi:hypothetical protein